MALQPVSTSPTCLWGEIALAGVVSLFSPSLPFTARAHRHLPSWPGCPDARAASSSRRRAWMCLGRAHDVGLSLPVPSAKPEGFSRAESVYVGEVPTRLVGGSVVPCLPSRQETSRQLDPDRVVGIRSGSHPL